MERTPLLQPTILSPNNSDVSIFAPLPPTPPLGDLEHMFNFEAPSTRLPPEEGDELLRAQREDLIAPWPSINGASRKSVCLL